MSTSTLSLMGGMETLSTKKLISTTCQETNYAPLIDLSDRITAHHLKMRMEWQEQDVNSRWRLQHSGLPEEPTTFPLTQELQEEVEATFRKAREWAASPEGIQDAQERAAAQLEKQKKRDSLDFSLIQAAMNAASALSTKDIPYLASTKHDTMDLFRETGRILEQSSLGDTQRKAISDFHDGLMRFHRSMCGESGRKDWERLPMLAWNDFDVLCKELDLKNVMTQEMLNTVLTDRDYGEFSHMWRDMWRAGDFWADRSVGEDMKRSQQKNSGDVDEEIKTDPVDGRSE